MSTEETSGGARSDDARPGACPPGSRWESAWLSVLLVADLLSIPFHLIAFTLTRGRHKRAFRRALSEAAA